MMKRATLLFVTLVSACSQHSSLLPGSTSFVTDQPSYDDVPGVAGGVANGTAQTTAAPATPPQGRTGTVEEADIYRVDQNRLFYFDTYRGFLVYDLSDTKNPRLLSRLPVYGYPIEMYVDGNTVYALLRDALYVTQVAGKSTFQRRDTSQLVTIDVTDPTAPSVLKTTDIVGELREGVSRKIDDTIYVVSYISSDYYYDFYDGDADYWGWYGDIDTQQDQAWVYSFDVSDAQSPQLVDKLQIFAGGDNQTSSSTSGMSRNFEDVQISATSNTLHVAENWQTYGWSINNDPYSCGANYSAEQAVVSVIDISDPNGAISLYSKFSTYGHLSDQFKQTYLYDPTTTHAYYYGIFDRQDWYYSDCSGGDYTQNQLEVWDITDGKNPLRVGALPFGQGETVGGSVFDLTNRIVYAATSQADVDPLYAISFSNPSSPQIVSSIGGLAGSISVFRFMDSASHFLLGIGADPSTTCTADQGDDWESSGISVSIFDVSNPSAAKLVQRKCVDVAAAAFLSSAVTQDLDQGHKMIGDTSIGGVNIVAVPVNYVSKQSEQSWWWWSYQSAVGLMTWDLSTYDPTKTTQQNVLTTHGSVHHPVGSVRRTIPFAHVDATGASRNMLLNLSDTYLSLYDISNIDAPVLQAQTEIAPDIEALFRFGSYVVEHVRTEGWSWGFDTASEFRVKAAPSGGVVDAAPTLASFTVGQVQNVVQWKNALAIFRQKTDGSSPQWFFNNQVSQLVVYDMTDPSHPKLSSVTDMALPLYPSWGFWCGGLALPWWGWWGGGSLGQWVSIDSGLAFITSTWNDNDTEQDTLVHVDLSDLTAPHIVTQDITHDHRDNLGLIADTSDPRALYLNYREPIGTLPKDGSLGHYHYYAQRWQLDGDNRLGSTTTTNIPGALMRSWKSADRTLFVTQDQRYTWSTEGYYTGDPRLFLLEASDSSATLLDSRVFPDRYLTSLVADGDALFVSHSAYYDTTSDPQDHLVIFDGSTSTLTPTFDGPLGLLETQLMGAGNGRLFVNLSGGGVLTLGVSDLTAPVEESFLRTLGWGNSLDISGDTLYVAGGNFGVFQRDLSATTVAAQ